MTLHVLQHILHACNELCSDWPVWQEHARMTITKEKLEVLLVVLTLNLILTLNLTLNLAVTVTITLPL